MTKVLITGATSNVGKEVIASLQNINHELEIYSGVRSLTEVNNHSNSDNTKRIQFHLNNLLRIIKNPLRNRLKNLISIHR